MNKKTFLKELSKRLEILSEGERLDIINEYEDIINEKIKHGKSEKEAILELGNMEDLSKDILESYKLNPSYPKRGNVNKSKLLEKLKKFFTYQKSNLIRYTDDLAQSVSNIDFKTVVCCLGKVLFRIIELTIFLIFLQILFVILIFMVGGLHNVFGILLELLYLGIALFIIFEFFYHFILSIEKIKSEKSSEAIEQKNSKKQKKEIPEESVSCLEKDVFQPIHCWFIKWKATFLKILLFIGKILVVIYIVFPLILCTIVLLLMIIIGIYLTLHHAYLFEIIFFCIGLFLFFLFLTKWVMDTISHSKKWKVYPMIVSLGMIILSLPFVINYCFSFTYYDKLQEGNQMVTTQTNKIMIPNHLHISYDEIEIDNTLLDNEVVVAVTYSDKLFTMKEKIDEVERCDIESVGSNCGKVMYYYVELKNLDGVNINKMIENTIIKALQDKVIYENMGRPYIKVITNSNTREKISY